MNLKFLKTKEFKIKLSFSIVLLILFSLSFLFEEKLERALGLIKNLAPNQVSESQMAGSDYEVHYLDVGQGNCTIVMLPDGKVMVIDGGNKFYGEKISDFLTARNVVKIDYLIASHADADHIGGMNYLFDKFEIENIFRPMQIAGTTIYETESTGKIVSHFEVYENEDLKEAYRAYGSAAFVETSSEVYRNFITNVYNETYMSTEGIFKSNVMVFYDGLKISGSGYELEFFAPLKTETEVDFAEISNTGGFMTKVYNNDSSNNSSAIMLLTILGDRYFFSGDASAPRSENDNGSKFEESDFILSLTEEEKTRFSNIDVYLAAHHGSIYSTSSSLVELLSMRFTIFSAGENSFGHPHAETIFRISLSENLERDGIFLLAETGDVTFSSVNSKVSYLCENCKKEEELLISYPLLAVIVFGLCEVIILSIRVKRKKV